MHHYPFHLGDYLKKTAHLTIVEDCAYRRLLDYYYQNESAIPPDFKQIARKIRMPEHADIVESILKEFFHIDDDALFHNNHCDEVLDAYHRQAQGGKDGAEKRWGKHRDNKNEDTQPIGKASLGESQANSNQKPETNNQKPIKNLSAEKSAGDVGFETFWKAYPKKVGKGAAVKAWKKMKPNLEKVLKALSWQVNSEQWQKDRGAFIPHPATYINQMRCEDEPPEFETVVAGGIAKPWFLTASGINKKAEQLGLKIGRDEQTPTFFERVLTAEGITVDMVRKARMLHGESR